MRGPRPGATLLRSGLVLTLSAMTPGAPAGAQERTGEWPSVRSEAQAPPAASPTLQTEGQKSKLVGIGKWVTLVASASASAYGFRTNFQADDEFEALDALCQAEESRCALREEDGTFVDEELERRFQDVLDKDRSARAALIVGQVGLAATVVLFIMDLNNDDPPDIPFDPPRLTVGPDRTELSARISLPNH